MQKNIIKLENGHFIEIKEDKNKYYDGIFRIYDILPKEDYYADEDKIYEKYI